jgi:AraC family transcriptional regulator, ethanolamine operon transcriptional activator
MKRSSPEQSRDDHTCKRIVLCNLDDLICHFGSLGLEHVQLESGRVRGEIGRYDLGSIIMKSGQYEAPFRIARGAFSDTSLHFFVSLSEPFENSMNGFALTPENIVAYPAGCEHEFQLNGKLGWLGIEVGHAEFNEFTEALVRRELAPLGQHCTELYPNPQSLSLLRMFLSDVSRVSQTQAVWLAKDRNRKRLKERLMEMLIESLLSAASGATVHVESRRLNFERIVNIACEYIRSHASSNISILDLCTVTHSSRSFLFEAFRDRLGVSPRQFIIKQRLNWARKLLRSSSLESTTVAAIAMDCGFGHLGRFSAHYKQIFGEYPSETLRGRR